MKEAEQTIHSVQLTEKGTRLTEQHNQYLFKVAPDANKIEIKRAVEELFGVHVKKVNTLTRKGKLKRRGMRQPGYTTGWKRAVVTLAENESIDLV